MKITLKRILLCSVVGTLVMFSSACDFTEMNTDPYNPGEVSVNMLLPAVQTHFSYHILANDAVRIPGLWVQQLVWTGFLPNADSYDVTESSANNLWEFYGYAYTLKNARRLIEQAEEVDAVDPQGRTNPHWAGVGRILEAWTLSVLTDLYGDMPYSDGFDPLRTMTPTYDSQEEIYDAIFSLLDQAVTDLERPAAENARVLSAASDLVYVGNRAQWVRLAHSLKARFHMRLSEAPGRSRTAQAEAALAALGNGLTSNTDNARQQFFAQQGQQNPWFQYAISGQWDSRDQVSGHYIDLLKSLEDPRLPVHARQSGAVRSAPHGLTPGFAPVDFDPDVHFDPEDDTYAGHYNAAVPGGGGGAISWSSIGEAYSAPNAPVWWMTYASQLFVEAEATLYVSGPAAAAPIYENAIRADLQRHGIASPAIEEYIASVPLPGGMEEALEAIITQKYIAGFLEVEPYNDFRRTGYPQLEPVPQHIHTRLDIIPLRLPYPSSELARNVANIPGYVPTATYDAMRVPVWWDTNVPPGALPNPTQ